MNSRQIRQRISATRPSRRRLLTICTAAIAVVALSGCTAAQARPEPSTTPRVAVAVEQHSQVALTCAAASVIESDLYNADAELRNGVISESQWAAFVDRAAFDFEMLAQRPEWGLQQEVRTLLRFIDASVNAPAGARFDPSTNEWDKAVAPINKACEANSTEIIISAASGG